MFGHFTYLVSILIFAGVPVILEVIFGFQLIKPFVKSVFKMIIISLLLVPVWDGVALWMKAWYFNTERNLNIIIAGDVLETYIFTLFIMLVISFAVYVWSGYEDKKLPILKTSWQDVKTGKYAIWKAIKGEK